MATTDTFLRMLFDRWNASIKSCDGVLNVLSDETLNKEIAPGKNRGIYLLGHLIAAHDEIFKLLGGEKMFPELHKPFLELPDKAVKELPSAAELRGCWARQCKALRQLFDSILPEQWFERHTAVSEEDFAKEPHRNKLNVILTRTTHLQYHIGQLILLK